MSVWYDFSHQYEFYKLDFCILVSSTCLLDSNNLTTFGMVVLCCISATFVFITVVCTKLPQLYMNESKSILATSY